MPVTQKIFGLARPAAGVTWADMVPLMQVEAAHVWSLYEQDVLREAWVRTDALGAVYVLESQPGEAARLLSAQPLAQQGLVDFELIPVGPFTPLTHLFGTQPHPIAPAGRRLGPGESATRVLAIDRPRDEVSPDALTPYLCDEAAYAWSLWKAGVVRENYLRTDRPGAALVLEVPGVDGARSVLSELPLVKAGLTEFECLSVATFMGFDALFDGSLDDVPEPLADPTLSARPASQGDSPPTCLGRNHRIGAHQ